MNKPYSSMLRSESPRVLGRLLELSGRCSGIKSHRPPQRIQRLAILKLWAAGECLMATPVVEAFKKRWDDLRITVITGGRCKSLWGMCPGIDEIISFPEEIFLQRSMVSLLSMIKTFRTQDFDAALILHHSYFFSIFSALAFPCPRSGPDRAGEGFLYHFGQIPLGKHRIDEHVAAAYALGAEKGNWQMKITPPPQLIEEMRTRLGDGRWLALAPGGGRNVKTVMPSKLYPGEKYLEVLRELSKYKSFQVLLIGDKFDASITTPLAAELGGMGIKARDCAGIWGWSQTAAALSLCCGFLGNDSAPLHLAAALNIPTLGLFGPTSPAETGPRGLRSAALEPERAHIPCYRHGIFNADCQDHCIDHIEPTKIAAKILDLLD